MSANGGNIFAQLPMDLAGEEIAELLAAPGLRIERIVSTGQASAPGQWYDQERPEWVMLLQGAAGVLVEGEEQPRVLAPGDYLHIPAHIRHRVEWTQAGGTTVWLAIHYGAPQAGR